MLRVPYVREFLAALIYGRPCPPSLWFGSKYQQGTAGRPAPAHSPRVPATTHIGSGAVAFVRRSPVITAMSGRQLLLTLQIEPLLALCLAGGLDFASVALGIFRLNGTVRRQSCAAAREAGRCP